jgi:hypothetical protein
MTNPAPVPTVVPVPLVPLAQPGASELDELSLLEEPQLAGSSAEDMIGMLMALMQSVSEQAMQRSENQLQLNQERLGQALDEFMSKMREALKKAEESKHSGHGGGLFGFVSDAFDAVADFVGDAIGKLGGVVDAHVDVFMAPLDLTMGLIQGGNLGQLLANELDDLGENGATAEAIEGFSEGVTKFAADALIFSQSAYALIEAGVSGDDLWSALGTQVTALKQSFEDNIENNPHFWEVAGAVLKTLAVASAVGSGGVLTPLAVVLLVASEANQRYHLADQLFEEKTAGYVSLGLEVGATALLLCAGNGFEHLGDLESLATDVKSSSSILSGVVGVKHAISEWQRLHDEADQLDLQADLLEMQGRIQRLQRAIDVLIDELGQQTDDNSRFYEDGGDVYRTMGATQLASIIRA